MLCGVPLIDYYGPQGWGSQSPPLRQRQHVATDLIFAAMAADPAAQTAILDVGCGDGSFLAHLASSAPDRDIRWIGVDYSEHQLARAAELPYEFHRCDLGDGLPFPDTSIDLVHAGEVLEHLYDPDHLLEECARVLRPGGHLVITTPNLQAWYNRALFLAGVQPIFYETSSRSTEVGAGPLRRLKTDTIRSGICACSTAPRCSTCCVAKGSSQSHCGARGSTGSRRAWPGWTRPCAGDRRSHRSSWCWPSSGEKQFGGPGEPGPPNWYVRLQRAAGRSADDR